MSKTEKRGDAAPVVHHVPAAFAMAPKAIGNNALVSARDNRLAIEVDISEAFRAKAQPSKGGALCIIGGGSQWFKIDGPDGQPLSIQVTVGRPNPAFDKAAAQRVRLARQLQAMGGKVSFD